MTKFDKQKEFCTFGLMNEKYNTDTVGNLLRKAREQRGMLLKDLATLLQLDIGLLSKIERDYRMPTKDQIQLFTSYFIEEKEDLMVAWLSDKILITLNDDDLSYKAITLAEEKMKYKLKSQPEDE